jgi:hypothetical protein
MRIVVYSQYYRARDPERQREIDACLAHNRQHPLISKLVLLVEEGAPAPPQGPVPCECLRHDARLTYADWLRLVPGEPHAIALLLNADIYLAEGLEHLPAVFDRPDTFLALTRYNPRPEGGTSLNDYPHWTQDCWGVRSDAPISAGLLHASGFPLGFPGCDNRIASVLWSHGFVLKNPSYHVRSVHRHADQGRSYDKSDDRLYGGVTYVHPSLSPAEPSELEHALWTRATSPTGGLVINQQAVGAGVHSLLHPDPGLGERFAGQQRYSGLSWSREALGSVHAVAPASAADWPSEDTHFLPLAALAALGEAWQPIVLRHPSPIAAACVRLPRHSPPGLELELVGVGAAGELVPLLAPPRQPLAGSGARTFLQLAAPEAAAYQELRLRFTGGDAVPWGALEGLELVLFGREGAEAKSLRRIAEETTETPATPTAPTTPAAPLAPVEPSPTWRRRDSLGDLTAWTPVARFGRRFQVLRSPDGTRLLFDDPFWPWVGESPVEALPGGGDDPLALLLWGYGQPRLDLRPSLVAKARRHRDDLLFWWPGSRTEEDAWHAHGLLVGPQRHGNRLEVYVGLPWATFAESGRWPDALLQAYGSRLAALRQALGAFGLELEVHSVCQHPRWRELAGALEAAGVTTVWLSQAPRDAQGLGGLRLQPWHLCPFGGADPAERPQLAVIPPPQRPFLASFQGEIAPEAATDAGGPALRQTLAALHHDHRWHVELGSAWPEETPRQGEAWDRHDRILSDSVFRLCPPGRGPIREGLWEALAVGAIPVLLGDDGALPEGLEGPEGEAIVLRHPVDALASLPQRLESLPEAEIAARSARALAAHRRRQRAVCFGTIARERPAVRLATGAPDPGKPTVVVPLHGPRDRWFWRSRKCAFYDIVLEWYQRGWINLRFSEGSYFWWGQEGEVLLFERDLIINLQDGKKNPPRWRGDVPYKHAFFANQYHLPSARHHTLTYWGYAPVLLEELRRQGRRSWEERSIGSLFAGSIENETQAYFRQRFHDWGELIEVYACADKLHRGEASPYPLAAYMELVQRSRFGVCFHGNGPKCYREIEYLALGTPLILTAGLEIDYPEPLQAGVHFLWAHRREDVPRLVAQTSPEQWERMSRACWEWFARNGTIERLFDTLATTIAGLDLQAPRHRQVRIRANRLAGASCRAARSLAIIDPQAQALFDDDPQPCPLTLDPDDLVITELPLVGREGEVPWRVGPQEMRATCAAMRASSHPQHRQLLTLLGLRLPNYTIRLQGQGGEIDPLERLEAGAVSLRGPEETAELRADFDWTRRCSMAYVERVRHVRGPARLEQTTVQAVLRYRHGEQEYHADVGPHFTDWYVVHERLIEPHELVQALKLWEYEGCTLLEIRGRLLRGGAPRDFEYGLQAD